MTETSSPGDSVARDRAGLGLREIQHLLATIGAALDQGDVASARETLAEIPLASCPIGLLAKTARFSKRAGALELWAVAGQRCVERFPNAPDGYLVLLADIDVLISDPALQQMALEVSRSALERLGGGDFVSPAVAFHVHRVIERFGGDRDLTARSQLIVNTVFAASDDGAVWRARDLMRRGELESAARALDEHFACIAGSPSDESVLVRGKIALADGRWGRDWAHLKALERLQTPVALNQRHDLAVVRALFSDLGESFDDGPVTPTFTAIASPESAAELICGRPATGRSPRPPKGLLLAGGSLAAGGAERLMAICFRELRRRDVLGQVDLAIKAHEPRPGAQDDPLFFLQLTGYRESELLRLAEPDAVEAPFSYIRGELGRRAQAWYDLLRDRNPQVVHAWLDYTMLTAGLAAVRAGVPKIILHSHNMRPNSIFHVDGPGGVQWRERGRGWRGIYRHLLTRPEVHFVNCSTVATQDYMDWIELDEASVNAHTVHNGLDFAPFDEDGSVAAAELRAQLRIPEGAPVVGTAMRFSAVKQPDHWLQAAVQIRRAVPNAHFVMLGDGSERESTKAKIEAAGASEYIHCPGRFSDIHLRLQLFDVFMLSSRSEGLPNVLIEAQACGVPVVAYDVGGVRETFLEGITGMLVRETDPDALATAAVDVLLARDWRFAAGEAGKRFVRQEFSIDKWVTRLEALITE
jgi:glycosyltransferase involved in cell wall biosynthesis